MKADLLFRQLSEKPYSYDFFQILRRIECAFPDYPRLGKALRPVDEPIRLAQEPSLAFASSSLALFEWPSAKALPRLEVRFFGLLGVNGPLPIHLTEYARERLLHHGDKTFARFLDLFHHRFIALFYQAWAQAQPVVHLDRPKEDRFAIYAGALQGAKPSLDSQNNTLFPDDYAKLYFTGLLSRQIRSADGLIAILKGYFRLPVRLEPFVGHWMTIHLRERTYLGGMNLGRSLE